jgi:hypothetical protein
MDVQRVLMASLIVLVWLFCLLLAARLLQLLGVIQIAS